MKLFVSWSGGLSKAAALGFADWARAVFPKNRLSVYFSPQDNKPGARWREVLKLQLSGADMAVLFLTRDSLASAWLLFEAGAVAKNLFQSSVPRIYPILVDITHQDLPSPLEQFQAISLLEEEEMWSLVSRIRVQLHKDDNWRISSASLRERFDTWWAKYRPQMKRRIKKAFGSTGDWSLVRQALISGHIAHSPFQAKEILRTAKHSVDFVAQNHHFITVERADEHFDLLRRFLSKKTRKVRFLAMSPDDAAHRAAIDAWTELAGTDHFLEDLLNAIDNLRLWKRLAKEEKWKGSLEIRLTGLIPTSQTFFDADERDGGLVMIPMMNRPSNLDRPAILIKRRVNPDAFNTYWVAHCERFKRAKVLK